MCCAHTTRENNWQNNGSVCAYQSVSISHTHIVMDQLSAHVTTSPSYVPTSLSLAGIRPKLTWNTFLYSLGHFRCKLNTQECVFKLTLCVLKTFHIFLRRFTFFLHISMLWCAQIFLRIAKKTWQGKRNRAKIPARLEQMSWGCRA